MRYKTTVDDLLEKGLFALTELIKAMNRSTQANMSEECSLYDMTIQAYIARDYILQAQKVIEDVVIRENKDGGQEE